MRASFTFETSLKDWRNYLHDISFWLDGYLSTPAYQNLEAKLCSYRYVEWNVGVGATASFTRAISTIARDGIIKRRDPFDPVIEVDMKQAPVARTSLGINGKLAIKVAEHIGLLDQVYSRRKADEEELRYYNYGLQNETDELSNDLVRTLVSQIIEILSTKRYLVVIENLDEPIKATMVDDLTGSLLLCFPPPRWKDSFWLISATSKHVYNRSKPTYPCLIEPSCGEDIVILTLHSLHQAAKYIMGAIGHKDKRHWHHVAVQCFHYATMLFVSHWSSPHGDTEGQDSTAGLAHLTSDELIRQWYAQGILVIDTERIMGEITRSSYDGKYNEDVYHVGNVILEAFREYSLLELPFSRATSEAENATRSAAHFLACHNLIAEHHTTDELCDGDHHHPRLEHMQWISHVGDQGWHLSREWLSHGASGPTTLILRHLSQQSRLLIKLESDHFFAKLPFLRVLDLSYTPLKSLPPSICYLQELQCLSLRGCYNLTSPFSFPNTETTLNLIFFDLSYSNINMFHCDFFYSMPNLQALVLVTCSNLEELPPSFAVLSSLRSFSLIGAPRIKIKQLSLRECRKLEYIDIKEVGELLELDLSATAIKELPDSIPNLPKLRQLLLLGVPALRRFPWHKLERLPDVFCLDQCSNSTINHSDTSEGAQVCISDSRLFCSFSNAARDLVRARKLLATFYVRVTSCKSTSSKLKDEEEIAMINKVQMAPPAYADVNHPYLTDRVSMVSVDDVPPCQVTEHHVEISAADRYPHGLSYLLEVTKSMSMWDDTHVSCLTDLSDHLDELEECKLRWCHKMVHVCRYNMSNLKNAYVSNLKILTHFYGRPYSGYDFHSLKHLILEYCPRLEGVVPLECELQKLETIDILSCYNLKAIFYDNGYSSSGGYKLPCLRRISLQELPLLEHLHVDNPMLTAPAWKELHVRGCWSLRSLPRFRQQPDMAVKVSGEQAWWNKLRWDGTHAHRGCYKPRLPPTFASRREWVVIKSYLR